MRGEGGDGGDGAISGSLESDWAHKHCLDVVTGNLSDKSATR
jgi:hypothetical protein